MTSESNKPAPRDLIAEAYEIEREYSLPGNLIDNGNLFFALGVFRVAYQAEKDRADKAEKDFCEQVKINVELMQKLMIYKLAEDDKAGRHE